MISTNFNWFLLGLNFPSLQWCKFTTRWQMYHTGANKYCELSTQGTEVWCNSKKHKQKNQT